GEMSGLCLGRSTLRHVWPYLARRKPECVSLCLSRSSKFSTCVSITSASNGYTLLPPHRQAALARSQLGPLVCMQLVRTVMQRKLPDFSHKPLKTPFHKKVYLMFLLTMVILSIFIEG
ncbi:unnamed protein product, partial [Candidula unifasciata]